MFKITLNAINLDKVNLISIFILTKITLIKTEIMKKKIELKKLKIKSFVTSVDKSNSETVKGGVSGNSPLCVENTLFQGCNSGPIFCTTFISELDTVCGCNPVSELVPCEDPFTTQVCAER